MLSTPPVVTQRRGLEAPGWTSLHSWATLKTSLLQVPPRAEEITIPADVTPEKVPTYIVDSSGIVEPPLPIPPQDSAQESYFG